MRHLGRACFFIPALALASCSSAEGPDASEGPLGAAQSAIAYGSPDSAHTAVVALLGNAGGGSFAECSGTIVQVKNGQGYVLTAAHCCNATVPSIVVVSNDYTVGEQYLFGGTPQPPAYAVTQGSVYYDAEYKGQDHDFCMLKFAAPANVAVIPVAQPGQDGVSLGVEVEHVGFGVTDTSSNNSGRRTATAPVDQSVTSLVLESSQGGATQIPGVCEGDSGGPALLPAGAPQGQQKVVATTSYGDSSSCAQNTMNVCSRVTSETGPGGFITSYLADTPTGTQAGSAQAACQQCANSAESGACQSQTQACAADPSCLNLDTCIGTCADQTCISQCETTAGSKATSELEALDTCICNTACTSQCVSQCGSSSTSSSSSSSGGQGCGVTTNDPKCDQCLDMDCCNQAQACVNDATCTACLVATPPASCNANALYAALAGCVNGSCAAPCGGTTTASSSSSSSSGAATSSSASSSSASAGAGPGSTGSGATAGTTGGSGAGTSGSGTSGAGGSGGGTSDGGVSRSSGCSATPGGAPAPGSIAGLVVGVAYALSRRRRAR